MGCRPPRQARIAESLPYLTLLSILLVAVVPGATRAASGHPQEEGFETDAQSSPPDQGPPGTDSDSVSLVARGGSTYQDLLAGLFRPGERGAVRTRPFDPLPRGLLKFGNVRLVGQWDEDLVYDDNVFLSERNRRRDTILRSSLGLVSELPFGGGRHRLITGYQMVRNRFLGGESPNFVEQFASGRLEMAFHRLSFRFGDRYEERTDPVLAVFTGKIERQLNTSFAGASWVADAWSVDLDGQSVRTDYASAAFAAFDRDENAVRLEGHHQIGSGLSAQVRVESTERLFDADDLNDAAGFGMAAGLRLEREGLIDLSSFLGWRHERFANDAGTDSDDEATTPDMELRARYQLGTRSALELDYRHTSEFSATSNYEEMDRTELVVTRQLSSSFQAWLGGALEAVTPSSGESFRRYSMALNLRYILAPNLHIAFDYTGRFRRGQGPGTDYDADTISIGLRARF